MSNLIKNAKLSVPLTLIAAASNTDQKTAVLDMAGFDGVMFITPITADSNTGVATLSVHDNTANSASGSVALAGASVTATSTGSSLAGKALIADVYKPLNRYIMGRIQSATASIAFGPTIAIQYDARNKPTVQDAQTIAAATQVINAGH